MNSNRTFNSLTQNTTCLGERIAENVAGQNIDLVSWIFERVTPGSGSQVLELCCGTGMQTTRLLDMVGTDGHVVALDISKEALSTLASRAGNLGQFRLTLIEANMDDLDDALSRADFPCPSFDMIFSAYGLYYSSNPQKVLEVARSWLRPNGSIVVIGPFGPNNQPLFRLLEECGVDIPSKVIESSRTFMFDKVIPWATLSFEKVLINTVNNRITWESPNQVLNYWRHSTFFAPERLAAVESKISEHFGRHSMFVNEKWIMMVQMIHART